MAKATRRFSKQTLTEDIQDRVNHIQEVWGFDPSNGWVQVESIAKDRMRTNPIERYEGLSYYLPMAYIAYGELCALTSLAESQGLTVFTEIGRATKTRTTPRVTRYRPEGSEK